MKEIKLAIVGSRSFNNYELLKKEINNFISENDFSINQIISGGARGADNLGEKYAKELNIETQIFYPDWNKYGKKAGFIRNEDIINNSDVIIAFWDGQSHGTKHDIELANKYKKILKIIYVS